MGSTHDAEKAAEGIAPDLVVFADNGAPPADLAWSWLVSHRWTGWRLEAVTVHEPRFADSAQNAGRDVHRQPPAEAGFTERNHLITKGDPRIVLSPAPTPR